MLAFSSSQHWGSSGSRMAPTPYSRWKRSNALFLHGTGTVETQRLSAVHRKRKKINSTRCTGVIYCLPSLLLQQSEGFIKNRTQFFMIFFGAVHQKQSLRFQTKLNSSLKTESKISFRPTNSTLSNRFIKPNQPSLSPPKVVGRGFLGIVRASRRVVTVQDRKKRPPVRQRLREIRHAHIRVLGRMPLHPLHDPGVTIGRGSVLHKILVLR